MSFLSGLFLLDCPASALNNAGKIEGSRTDNTVAVKQIKTREGIYPYVSAQAFRYWWREALKEVPGWTSSPIFREGKIAYTDANPLLYAEDDCFGYMRAPSKKADAKKSREENNLLAEATPVENNVVLTRQSPLKVSTLVSLGPLREVTTDFGVMSRHEGDAVPFEHEFYRSTLQGLFSLDLRAVGRFYHIDRTGFRHIDQPRIKQAQEMGLQEYDNGKAYQLSLDQRYERIKQLLQGFSKINGGAKLSIHYTDVSPKFIIIAVAKGGNHLFSTSVGTDSKGLPEIKNEAIKEAARVFKDEIISGIYVGLPYGYLDAQREKLIQTLSEITKLDDYGFRKTFLGHPKEVIDKFLKDLEENKEVWLV
ncbi:type I-B CRISPR-associated protein Cas7/Cst2/DevR [Desulforamulus hydrothermalis]|uniref:CRISPR-associated regulatory protein, DevR family n=1 Tax=Desulforamulus hydrothermalis Lam5 = DSM 18033 TaxID=1121428 RepID=K8E872_9FIRM|nr:type I-B CRISPR-associated protein Cas7/Cst2/DevR [Desulforamulus hydrothermalis]CCO07698.1 CRISPR-associated regulatory protein, DevR family [Desulforamulus hydrothermalis Lam5 = DSM 18033]SHH25584.1 CRISPR-associated autoregulator, Cst2 family [Desulforamulus hydrothermalis Lam5 = DSM 18033]